MFHRSQCNCQLCQWRRHKEEPARKVTISWVVAEHGIEIAEEVLHQIVNCPEARRVFQFEEYGPYYQLILEVELDEIPPPQQEFPYDPS